PLILSPRDRFTVMALRVRSRIMARSSSANTLAICAMARPYGLARSKLSAMATSWMPFLSKSAMTLAASATQGNKRSSLATITGVLLLRGSGEELAACGTAGEGFATTDSGLREDFGQAESLHSAVGGDALALGFETEAAVGLFFAGDADVANGVAHGVSECTP